MKLTRYFQHLLVVGTLLGTGLVQAQPEGDGFAIRPEGLEPVRTGTKLSERFKIVFGGYVLSDFSSTIALKEGGIGIGIDPAQTLGLDFKNKVFRIDGHYRLTPEHALTYSWYRINSRGTKTIDEEIEWGDVVIPIGATVQSDFGYDILKLGYLWSFYHNDKVEMALGAGLHVTRFKLDLNATVTTPPGASVEDVSLTAPLPVVGVAVAYNITPRLTAAFQSQIFALAFDQWDGNYRDSTLSIEYRFWKNVGLGLGINGNSLKVKRTRDNTEFLFTQNITGGMLYVATYF